MTVREFIEKCSCHNQIRWFDRTSGEELFDIPMPNESKHHFRDRKIYMMFPCSKSGQDKGYLLDIYLYPNVKEDTWLKGV